MAAIMLLSLWMEKFPPTKSASLATSAMPRIRQLCATAPGSFSQTFFSSRASKPASSSRVMLGRTVT